LKNKEIDCHGIRLKCTSQEYDISIQNPDIKPSKTYASSCWIRICDFSNLYYKDFHEYITHSYETIVKTLPDKIQKKLLKKLSHERDSPGKILLVSFLMIS
jgi:predicted DNA-binding protein (MmcQ/YjbR family)